MSATVGAALKKLAVALLTDKRVLKTLGGIILGILIIIIMPVVAVISVFNGNIELDTNALQQQIVAQMTAELQFIEDTMNAIETEMTKAGFPERIKEAQVLYVLALSDYAHKPDFVTKLVGCFAKDQTDEQLIAKVNETFGTELGVEDFPK